MISFCMLFAAKSVKIGQYVGIAMAMVNINVLTKAVVNTFILKRGSGFNCSRKSGCMIICPN